MAVVAELELIRSHAEREAVEQELSESRQTVASLNRVVERMQVRSSSFFERCRGWLFFAGNVQNSTGRHVLLQTESDGTIKRLRAELDAAVGEAVQLRHKVEEVRRAVQEAVPIL